MTEQDGKWYVTGVTSWASGGPTIKGSVYCIEDRPDACAAFAFVVGPNARQRADMVVTAPALLRAIKRAQGIIATRGLEPGDAEKACIEVYELLAAAKKAAETNNRKSRRAKREGR